MASTQEHEQIHKEYNEYNEYLKTISSLYFRRKTKIDFEGFNMSMVQHPKNTSHFLATMRQVEHFSHDAYPQAYNKTFLLELDSLFRVVHSTELKEISSSRKVHRSYSIGLEDCRLVNEHFMTAVTLDTNDDWLPEMSLCNINYENGEITKVQPLHFGGDDDVKFAEKNWLVLKYLERNGSIHLIHSYDPLRIVSVDINNGYSSLISMKRIFHLNGCEIHGGACIYLSHKKQYLVAVRVVQNHSYMFSHWILLNDLYTFVGISGRFYFEPYSEKKYEMCMSLTLNETNKKLFASVSINDENVYVYEYMLEDILNTIEIDKK